MTFDKKCTLPGKQLGDLLCVTMGYSMQQPVDMKLKINDPFNLPENFFLINGYGIDAIEPLSLEPKSRIELTGPTVSTDSFIDAIEEEHHYMHVNLIDLPEAVSKTKSNLNQKTIRLK